MWIALDRLFRREWITVITWTGIAIAEQLSLPHCAVRGACTHLPNAGRPRSHPAALRLMLPDLVILMPTKQR